MQDPSNKRKEIEGGGLAVSTQFGFHIHFETFYEADLQPQLKKRLTI